MSCGLLLLLMENQNQTEKEKETAIYGPMGDYTGDYIPSLKTV